jgi:hypothetical protein
LTFLVFRGSLELSKKELGAFNYFINDSTVKIIDSNYVFTPYPLQQVFITNTDKQILLSTDKNEDIGDITKSNNFIDVNGNLIALNQLHELSNYSLHLSQKECIEVNGVLLFKNENTHAIFSILNMFKQ